MSADTAAQPDAARILGEVSSDEAFYFYSDLGMSTGASAKSLAEFLTIVRQIDIRAVEFHIFRGDFEAWFKMLGDETLAKQTSGLKGRGLIGEALRKRLLQLLQLRYGMLRKKILRS